jgi:hypothetical protein
MHEWFRAGGILSVVVAVGAFAASDGRVSVCEGPQYTVNFITRPCAPLSDYNPYEFTFSNARHSSLSRTKTRPIGLGNVVPVQVGGQYVRCGRNRSLVVLSSGIFPLSCVIS